MRNHAILAAVGTDGDVYPILALGTALRRRGYRVTLASHDRYASRAADGGLEFRSLVSEVETDLLLQQQDLWHPLRSALVIARWGGALVPRQYEILEQLSAGGDSFLVGALGVVAARLVQERTRVPLISVILQPWIIPSLWAPPAMMGGLTLPRWAPRPIGSLYFRLIDLLGTRLVGAEFRKLRASLGLKPVRRMFRWWWFSPELVVGLFPEWFGPPQPDWPPQIKLAGFPLHDGRSSEGLSPELLRFCRQKGPLIAVTFGTGMRHATAIFQQAIEACQRLNQRVVLLTSFRAQLPSELPEFVHHCEFAPFQDLFPLCAAVIHHGGIGTVAKALAAGTPQLILPFAFDQLDNALRVKRLGTGDLLKANERHVQKIAASLSKLTTAESTAAAKAVARRLNCRSGLECAADHFENLVRTRTPVAT